MRFRAFSFRRYWLAAILGGLLAICLALPVLFGVGSNPQESGEPGQQVEKFPSSSRPA